MAIDLYAGRGGWTRGLLDAGFRVLGFDIERFPDYPGELVIQDVLTLDGRQFRHAALIVASPPCQEYSYRAMPWKQARAEVPEHLPEWWAKPEPDMTGEEMVEWIAWRTAHPLPPPDNALFEACFRIQREAIEATGRTCRACAGEGRTLSLCRCESCDGSGVEYRHIPLVVENVKGAQPWVGPAKWHFGSFFLWGDVPAIMPFTSDGCGGKVADHVNKRDGFNHTRHLTNPVEHEGIKIRAPGHYQRPGSGKDWFDMGAAAYSSHSSARKAASAQIAMIPYRLARWIGEVFLPRPAATLQPDNNNEAAVTIELD